MKQLLYRFRGLAIAMVVLALSAGLAFGAQPEASAWGLANASSHAGKTVPVKTGQAEEAIDEDVDEDEDTEEEVVEEEAPAEEEGSEEDGDNCATDPTTLTEEELADMKHGSIVCWAAHQTEWPEEFANHGAWVRSWAHKDKSDDDEASADEDAGGDGLSEQSRSGNGKGNGKGKNK